MIELQEREEQQVQEEKLTAERESHNKLMTQANLEGVETLIDDMVGGWATSPQGESVGLGLG
jgi:hypothetical protein